FRHHADTFCLFVFSRQGISQTHGVPIDVESRIFCRVVGCFFCSSRSPSPPPPPQSTFSFCHGAVRCRWRRKNRWRSPFGMPPCVLWMRSLAVPLWQDYSSTKSCVQLAPFSENGTRNGYGGRSIGPRHDLATACRGQRLVCA